MLAVVLAGMAYLGHIHQLGFPDGSVSVLENAQRRLAWLFVAVSLGMAFVLAGLALRAAPTRWLGGALGTYALMVLTVWVVNGCLVTRLAHEGIG